MEPIDFEWTRKYAIARAHVNANSQGKTFVVAFNKDKRESVLCCSLEKLLAEHPYDLVEEDVLYRAEPGAPVPAEIA